MEFGSCNGLCEPEPCNRHRAALIGGEAVRYLGPHILSQQRKRAPKGALFHV